MKECPVCGNENLYKKNYSEDGRTVETHERCEACGEYNDEWAYGRQGFYLNGRTWEFTDHPYLSDEDEKIVSKSWNEIEIELKKCKYYKDFREDQ